MECPPGDELAATADARLNDLTATSGDVLYMTTDHPAAVGCGSLCTGEDLVADAEVEYRKSDMMSAQSRGEECSRRSWKIC